MPHWIRAPWQSSEFIQRFRLKVYLPEDLGSCLMIFLIVKLVHLIIAKWISRPWKVTRTPKMCYLSGNVKSNMCKHFFINEFTGSCKTYSAKFAVIRSILCNNSWCNQSRCGSYMTILSSLHYQFCSRRLSRYEYLECNMNGGLQSERAFSHSRERMFILIAGLKRNHSISLSSHSTRVGAISQLVRSSRSGGLN